MTPRLLLADHRAGWWRTVSLPALTDTATPLPPARRATLAEHAGVLRLPAGAGARAVFADDARGALVVLHDDDLVSEIPLAIPAEHLACDPSGRYVACTTGLGASWEPWSDLLTLVDLTIDDARRVRLSRTGEPGVALVAGVGEGEPQIVLRHREPGSVEVLTAEAIWSAGAHCPQVAGATLDLAGDLGHGDALDATTGVLHCATEAGIERILIAADGPQRWETWPWPVAGRAYFLRLDPVTRTIVAALRGGPSDPSRWHEWTNHVAVWSLDDGSVRVQPTGNGLVFRPDTLGGEVAWSVVHPDGDQACRWTHTGAVTSVPLPPMSAAPRPGATPWDPVDGRSAQRRALAILDEHRIAVTRGGDGELHVIDGDTLTVTRTLDTPLNEGGHLCLLPGAPDRLVDGIGR